MVPVPPDHDRVSPSFGMDIKRMPIRFEVR